MSHSVEGRTMGKDLKGRELGRGIKQRKNGSYEGRYIDPYGIRKSIYSKDLNELKKLLRDKEYERDHHINVRNENMTLDEWYTKWMMVYKKGTIKRTSYTLYQQVYNKHISPQLGKISLIEITKISIQNLINEMYENGYSWSVQDKVKRLLTDMFGRAIEDEYCIRNPVKGIRLKGEKNSYKVLTREEQAMFFETATGTFYENLFLVAVNTGLRPGELFALTEENIDFKEKIIKVRRNLIYGKYDDAQKKEFFWETPKTKSSIRDVPINSICEKALKNQLMLKKRLSLQFPNNTEFSDVIFVSGRNNPLNTEIYHDAIDRIRLMRNELLGPLEQIDKFGGHTFRHTFATRCIESGVKPKTLQTFLGHATLEMTMNLYVHTMEDMKQEEIKLLEECNNNIYTFSSL